MATKKEDTTTAEDTLKILDATKVIVQALKPLSQEDRMRALRAACVVLDLPTVRCCD